MNKCLQQGTPEWVEMRNNYIGGSDAPVIMNASPWKTRYQLMEEKLGLSKPFQSQAMKRGIEMEENARSHFEKLTGYVVFPTVVISKKRPWQMASMDGLTIEKDTAVEIKCPGAEDHQLAEKGKVPEHYFPQLQHQMEVCDLDIMFYFSFDGKNGKILEVKRDQSYIDLMNEEEKKFWDLRQKNEMPELSERDFIEMNGIEWRSISDKWKDVYLRLKQIEKEEENLREELIKMSDNRNSRGNGVSLTRYLAKGSVDYHSIPQIKGIDLEAYRKPSSVRWRTSIK